MSNNLFLRFRQSLYDHYFITINELAKLPQAREISYNLMCSMGFKGIPENFSRIAPATNTQFQRAGLKVVHALLQLRQERGGQFLSIIIELGRADLYCQKTVSLARRLIAQLLGKCPLYAKVERMNAGDSLIHVHVCALVPDGLVIPEAVRGFRVRTVPLGVGRYAEKSVEANLCDFIRYLFKPADARADRSILANRKQMYLEWVLEMEAQCYGQGTWENVRLRWPSNLERAWERWEHISTTTPSDPAPDDFWPRPAYPVFPATPLPRDTWNTALQLGPKSREMPSRTKRIDTG